MSKKNSSDPVARFLFVTSTLAVFFIYGVVVGKFHLFPYNFLEQAMTGFKSVFSTLMAKQEWYYSADSKRDVVIIPRANKDNRGLNLVTRIAADKKLAADIIDMDNRTIHHWDIDWFTIWPDVKHIGKEYIPKSRPGTHIHGAVVMENGDLIFNFEHCGLARIDLNGKVVWRLPYQTHHSVHRHSNGNLWVCGQRDITKPTKLFPHRQLPFAEYTILEISPSGDLLEEWSVAELLAKNGYTGLLYMGGLRNFTTEVKGDILHLNDVEPFPDDMKEGFFSPGDILVSLRNINTVFVFNRQNNKIKFISTGRFVRQHDPDFIDGNRFSVLDNNNIAAEQHGHQSRIAIVSAPEGTVETFFRGKEKSPFYTDIAGKHQWLANGNLLITEARKGRAFEINRQGRVVWQYKNYIADDIVGLVEEVQRLPANYDAIFNKLGSGSVNTDSTN